VNKKIITCKVCELPTAEGSDFCGQKHRLFYMNFRNGFANLKCLEKQKKRKYTRAQLKAYRLIKRYLINGNNS